jgi:hypothetical protein
MLQTCQNIRRNAQKPLIVALLFCQFINTQILAPPFQITPAILNQVAGIAQMLGQLTSFKQPETTLRLRRANRIRTVQGSLAIEANTLNEADIKAFLECHTGYYLYAVCSSGGQCPPYGGLFHGMAMCKHRNCAKTYGAMRKKHLLSPYYFANS